MLVDPDIFILYSHSAYKLMLVFIVGTKPTLNLFIKESTDFCPQDHCINLVRWVGQVVFNIGDFDQKSHNTQKSTKQERGTIWPKYFSGL